MFLLSSGKCQKAKPHKFNKIAGVSGAHACRCFLTQFSANLYIQRTTRSRPCYMLRNTLFIGDSLPYLKWFGYCGAGVAGNFGVVGLYVAKAVSTGKTG